MRLFEAMVDANHRALAGDTAAGLHLADFFAAFLPIAALTCIDARLNPCSGDAECPRNNSSGCATRGISSRVR